MSIAMLLPTGISFDNKHSVPWRRKGLDAAQQKAALPMSEHRPSDPLASWLGTATPAHHPYMIIPCTHQCLS